MHTKINTAFAFFVSCCGYIAIAFQAITHLDDYQAKIDSMWVENSGLRQEVNRLQTINESFRVTATMYHPVRQQTDSTPNELADGTIVEVHKAHTYRYVALSRDLLDRWGGPFNYGDYIIVENAGDHSGVWQVRDTMNERWTKRIDFLMSPSDPPFKYEEVVIRSQKRL